MPQKPIVPTIGRKLYYFPVMDPSSAGHQAIFSRYDDQPLDATIIYVWPKKDGDQFQNLNLAVIDHNGLFSAQHNVPLLQDGEALPTDGPYAAWMPYQLAQAAKEPDPAPVPPSAPTPLSNPIGGEIAQANPALTFGDALVALKGGKKVARAGWNGRGMFLFLVPGSTFQVNRAPLLGIYPEGTTINYHAHIDMRTADGTIVPWLCSQTDALSEDWQVIE